MTIGELLAAHRDFGYVLVDCAYRQARLRGDPIEIFCARWQWGKTVSMLEAEYPETFDYPILWGIARPIHAN